MRDIGLIKLAGASTRRRPQPREGAAARLFLTLVQASSPGEHWSPEMGGADGNSSVGE